jgi:hypothetical protein
LEGEIKVAGDDDDDDDDGEATSENGEVRKVRLVTLASSHSYTRHAKYLDEKKGKHGRRKCAASRRRGG